MTEAEIPQPISRIPARWGQFTGAQLAWLAIGAAAPYLLVRLGLGLAPALLFSCPWLAACTVLAFGRCEGRRVDLWLGDWLAFRFQPHRLVHPERERPTRAPREYFEVDGSVAASRSPVELEASAPGLWRR